MPLKLGFLLLMMLLSSSPVCLEWVWAAQQARAPRLRTMREFAEQEITIPDGPCLGNRFRADYPLPYTGLWLDAVDSGRYNEIISTGPTQSGKSLLCYVLPLIYSLFELREPMTICGIPHLDMANEKWLVDILPIIRQSRYRDQLPDKGPGSRQGSLATGKPIRFRGGQLLRFMTGGGGDKTIAGSTTRVLAITETDGLERASSTSRETDRIGQLKARTRAYSERRVIFKECTVSIEQGHTWQRYLAGTRSTIVLPCPHCHRFVSPEREHLRGWQDAQSEDEARQKAHFCCPACGKPWTEDERREANTAGRLIHRGQRITPEGEIRGPHPPTRCLGFRWSAVNNLLATSGDIGVDEWNAARAVSEENAEKEMLQFVWCRPWVAPSWDETPLDAEVVRRRFGPREYPRGVVPAETEYFTVGVDLHKRFGAWIAIAWLPQGSSHVVDYGTFEIPSDDMDLDKAMLLGLRDFQEDLIESWTLPAGGEIRLPDQVWIDARYMGNVVYRFVEESGPRFRPIFGCGAGQYYVHRYHQPKKTGALVKFIGDHYHVIWSPKDRVFVIEIDADHWKGWLHQRLSTPEDKPGAMRLYHSSDRNEHTKLSKQLTAEKPTEEFIPGKGTIRRWVREHRQNHLLDAGYIACAAGHLCGVRLIDTPAPGPPPPRRPQRRAGLTMPDGRPYLVTER